MELKIPCGTWIREEDERVLEVLRASDGLLSAEELAERTGLPVQKTARTLKLLKQQTDHAKAREALSNQDGGGNQ